MNSFYVDLGFSVMFSVLKQTIKNAQTKAEVEAAFLKLHDQIEMAYPEHFEAV